jgi:hypothetical protein
VRLGQFVPVRWFRRNAARRRKLAFEKLTTNYFEAKYSADGVISRHDLSAVLPPNPDDYEYRLYLAEWTARQAAKRSRCMFLAIGTATGKHVKRVLERVKPTNPYWLVDSWDGRRSATDASIDYPESTDFDAIRRTFEPYPNVHLLRGLVPDVLSQLPQDRIAFAYFCLGDTDAEIKAFRILLPRIDAGGMMILNGFARRRTSHAQRREFMDIARQCNIEPLVMTSGQALIVG